MATNRRIPFVEAALAASAVFLLFILVAEIRAQACGSSCANPPSGTCQDDSYSSLDESMFVASFVNGCCCDNIICWYYDAAGICWNADKTQCVSVQWCLE
jgi:hypothetical protein